MSDECEQFGELRSLLLRESCQKRLLMCLSKPRNGVMRGSSGFGEIEGIVAAVARVHAALKQLFAFKLVDVGHHAAGQCPQGAGKRTLADARGSGQDFEDACVRGSELEHG